MCCRWRQGDYVSVSSQAGTERADLAKERQELAAYTDHEHAELAAIHVARGLDAMLAHDALGASLPLVGVLVATWLTPSVSMIWSIYPARDFVGFVRDGGNGRRGFAFWGCRLFNTRSAS